VTDPSLLQANLGFPHYHNSFDVVHARAIGGGVRFFLHSPTTTLTLGAQIKDYTALLRDLTDTLRPGGVLLLADGNLNLLDSNRVPMALVPEDDPTFNWVHKVFFTAYNGMKERGAQMDPGLMAPKWISEIEELEGMESRTYVVPVGAWLRELLFWIWDGEHVLLMIYSNL
jgi:hypothetical protein